MIKLLQRSAVEITDDAHLHSIEMPWFGSSFSFLDGAAINHEQSDRGMGTLPSPHLRCGHLPK